MNVNERIQALRLLMKEKNISAYIIPSCDSHQSEYTTDHFKSREWISGFTGSAGTVIVTEKNVALFTDGRYFLQAEEQLKSSEIRLFKMGEKDVPSTEEYLINSLNACQIVGFDGKLFSHTQVEKMKNIFKQKDIKLNGNYDLIDDIWKDRPSLPVGDIFIHDIKYSGRSVGNKLKTIREKMNEKKVDYYLMSSLDDIAWTFNIRGCDIPYNPVVISYALIGHTESKLFIDDKKLNDITKDYLLKNNIEVYDYLSIESELKGLSNDKAIYFDPSKTSTWCYENMNYEVNKICGEDIVENLKAIKNEIEIENFKKSQIRDGVALVNFLYWLDSRIGNTKITEISASEKLEEFRSKGENYVSLSFETIAGYKDHGAIVHYSAKKESEYELKKEGMLLLDSGAQYLDGTTDITRTIVLGEISSEEKRDFTLVLKGHIALSRAKFLYGTSGTHLDIIARMPLLEEGKDYKHGTGHGIGYLLSVHEGPQRISPVYSKVKLESGMLITNEPGFYKKNEYGIRTENILLVREDVDTEFGKFMKFETTTLCPIDLKGIDESILNNEERDWINNYHKTVLKHLSPHLDHEECSWLKTQTREI